MVIVWVNIMSATQNTFLSLIWPRTHQFANSALSVLNLILGTNQTIRKLSQYSDYIIFLTQLHFISKLFTYIMQKQCEACLFSECRRRYLLQHAIPPSQGPKEKIFLRHKLHKIYQFSRSSSMPMEFVDNKTSIPQNTSSF